MNDEPSAPADDLKNDLEELDKSLTRWGRFSDRALEAQFREHSLPSGIFTSRLFLFAAAILQIPFVMTDYRLFGTELPFFLLILGRVVFISITIGLAVFLAGNRDLNLFRRSMSAWVVLLLSYNASIDSTRPSEFLGHLHIEILAVLVCYILLPLSPQRLILLGVFGTTLHLLTLNLFRTNIDALEINAAVSAFVGANLVGAIHAVRAGASQRREYLALLEANQTNRELREAMNRIRSLEGLLPICSHCKNIRDTNDAWKPVEAYVQEKTAATFTHSICPCCLERYYPEYAKTRIG